MMSEPNVAAVDNAIDASSRPQTLIVLGVSCVLGVFIATIFWRMAGPTVHPDEFGFLINGQIFLGNHEAAVPTGSFYPVGYGVVTALGALIGGGIAGGYRFALFFNLACAVCVGMFVYVIGRRIFALSQNLAVVAGCLVFVAPGTIVSAGYAWPETVARMMALVWVFILARTAEKMNPRLMMCLGFLVGILPVIHGRFTLFIPITLMFFAWWFIQKDSSRLVIFVSTVLIFVGYFVAYQLNTFVKTLVYTTSYDQENRLLLRLFKPELWPALVRSIAGQSWYLLATSFGLVGVAVAFFLVQLRSSSKLQLKRDPQTVAMVAIVLGTLAILFTGGLQLLYGRRADHYIYGRYVEVMAPGLWLLGVVAISRFHRRVSNWWAFSILFFVGIGFAHQLFDGFDRVRDGYTNRTMVFPNTVGVDAMGKFVTPGLVAFSLAFACIAIILWSVHKWFNSWAVVLLIVLLASGSALSGQRSLLPRGDYFRAAGVSVGVATAGDVQEIGSDKGISNDALYYFLRYKIHPVRITYLDISSPEAVIPAKFECLYGWKERPPLTGEWEIVAEEAAFHRVLFRRVGSISC